jgi:hypothetical protein
MPCSQRETQDWSTPKALAMSICFSLSSQRLSARAIGEILIFIVRKYAIRLKKSSGYFMSVGANVGLTDIGAESYS